MSSLTPFAQPTAYESFVSSGPKWFICEYGTPGSCAVGFRGTYDAIEKCLIMFDNHDYQVPTAEQPNPLARSKPRWIQCGNKEGLAYVTMTHQRLEETLECFFFCEVLRVGEIDIIHTEIDSDPTNEDENGTITIESRYDEAAVAGLARQYAARFLAEQITTASFIPAAHETVIREYAIGHLVSDTGAAFESLVDSAL